MVELNDLTVNYLEKLAKECNISLKKSNTKLEKIKQIQEANIPKEQLEHLVNKFLTEKKVIRKISKANLEKRVNLLEKQVKLLTNTLNEIKNDRYKGEIRAVIEKVSNFDEIKKIIITRIKPGNTLSVDELIEIKELQEYPLTMIARAIIDLIEDEILLGLEGDSIQKIGGKIGLLIRK
ncbi:MAG: hypothetical protein ACFE9T_02110 [Promethearchaeota archaeon]